MKNLLLSFCTLFLGIAIFAQNTVPNAGFENWTNGSADGWQSSFSVTFGFFPISYTSGEASEDAHSGNYAMSLTTETLSVAGQSVTLPGICQLGNFETDSILAVVMGGNGDIDPARLVSGGVPFNALPKKVKVWAKYLPDAMSNDAMQVIVLATKNTISGAQIVARGTYKSMTMLDEYTEITIPVEVEMEGETPDFLNIIFASAGTYNCGEAELLVDDVTVEAEMIGVCNINALSCSVAPNPTSDFIRVDLENNDNFTFELYDMNGRKVLAADDCAAAANIDVRGLAKGTYIAKIIQGNDIVAKKVVIE